MVKTYKVANHVFSIEMDGSSSSWETLANYAPFEIPAAEDPLFRFDVSFGRADAEDKVEVLVGAGEPEAARLDIWKSGEDWWIEIAPIKDMAPVGAYRMSEDFREGHLHVFDERYSRFAIDNAAMLTFAFATSPLMTLEMHASTVVNDGKAYLFLAKSGTGKSTHSRMWLESIPGTRLLNDDNPIVGFDDEGKPRAYGSPWSGKTPCYINDSAPIGAFVLIHRAPSNAITRMGLIESYATLSSSCSGFKAVPSMADGLHRTLSAMVMGVPVFRLDCLPDHDAAKVCHDGVQ